MSARYFPLSKYFKKTNRVVWDMVSDKIASTDWSSQQDVGKLSGWVNGVAVMEKDKDIKVELVALKRKIQGY